MTKLKFYLIWTLIVYVIFFSSLVFKGGHFLNGCDFLNVYSDKFRQSAVAVGFSGWSARAVVLVFFGFIPVCVLRPRFLVSSFKDVPYWKAFVCFFLLIIFFSGVSWGLFFLDLGSGYGPRAKLVANLASDFRTLPLVISSFLYAEFIFVVVISVSFKKICGVKNV